jgi:ABC-type phosphate/phosphonate transport system substrate-binding protein
MDTLGKRLYCIIVMTMCVGWVNPALAQETPFVFGVLPQRTPILTAQYWNPILNYISTQSGVPLQLKLNKTPPEHDAMIQQGEFDFIYSNHHFFPWNEAAGYKVIARPWEAAIRGEIVVLANSPIHSLAELQGKEVGFPHRAAFVGYLVPLDALLKARIHVQEVIAVGQEGIMGQLKAGRVAAAGVNSQVMRDFAKREKIDYRVLWSSEEYFNIPIVAHPRVPREKVAAVRAALLHMAHDPVGLQVLTASAALIKLDPPYGFVAATDSDYDNIRMFFKHTLVKSH